MERRMKGSQRQNRKDCEKQRSNLVISIFFIEFEKFYSFLYFFQVLVGNELIIV